MTADRHRTAIASFFKDSQGRLTMSSLTVFGSEGPGDFEYYDVDWSRDRGAYLYHMSGAGGSLPVQVDGIYAVSGKEVEVSERPSNLYDEKARLRNATRRLRRIPAAFRLEEGWDFLDWLEHNGIHGDAVWCAKCRDFMHEDSPCEHVWWCDRTGTWSTPDDRCKCQDREECSA